MEIAGKNRPPPPAKKTFFPDFRKIIICENADSVYIA